MAQQNIKIAKRYAKAFVRAVAQVHTENNNSSKLPAQLKISAELVDAIAKEISLSQDSIFFFHNPTIPEEKKQHVLQTVVARTAEGFSSAGIVSSFLSAIVRNGRSDCLVEIGKILPQIVREYLGVIPVTVTTSRELSADEKGSIEGVIRQQAPGDVEFHWHVDQSVIGGIIVASEGKRFDASILGRLESIRKSVHA